MSSIVQPNVADIRLDGNIALAKFIGYFVLVDLLFLPYFQIVILPFSLPVLCLSILVLNTTVKNDNYVVFFLILMSAAVLSATTAFVAAGSLDHVTENFKRVIQLFTSFLYFFYFRWLAARVPLKISPIIVVFIVWFGCLAVAFLLRPDTTGEIIRSIYGRLVTSEESLEAHLRFAYVFTDPNTAAYFLLIAGSILLMERRSFLTATLLVTALVVLTFLTQSRGAMIALALMVIATIYPPRRFVRSLRSTKKAVALFLIALGFIIVFLYLKPIAEQSTGLAELAYKRFFDSPEQYSTGGSRFEIWKRFATNLLPLPFGRGYLLAVEGGVQGTHSDFFRIIYSYGIVAVIPAIMFFFSRIVSFTVLIIPALMAFFINSLIDEQKLLGLFLSLLAICIGSEERQRAAASQGECARVH
jgi:hypothetical protein